MDAVILRRSRPVLRAVHKHRRQQITRMSFFIDTAKIDVCVNSALLRADIVLTDVYCRCWLSVETGLLWAFVAPAMLVVLVSHKHNPVMHYYTQKLTRGARKNVCYQLRLWCTMYCTAVEIELGKRFCVSLAGHLALQVKSAAHQILYQSLRNCTICTD